MTRARGIRSRAGRAALILVAVAVTSAFAACTLNPQPLPPGDDSEATGNFDASADAGGFSPPETPPQASDAGTNADHEAGTDDAGDAGGDAGDGDAGDGGDASDAADAG